jgi:hypothetical protein
MDVDFPRALQDAIEEMEQAGRLDIARNLPEIRWEVNNSPSKLLAMMIIKGRRKRTELLRIRKKILLSIVFALGSENGKDGNKKENICIILNSAFIIITITIITCVYINNDCNSSGSISYHIKHDHSSSSDNDDDR